MPGGSTARRYEQFGRIAVHGVREREQRLVPGRLLSVLDADERDAPDLRARGQLLLREMRIASELADPLADRHAAAVSGAFDPCPIRVVAIRTGEVPRDLYFAAVARMQDELVWVRQFERM